MELRQKKMAILKLEKYLNNFQLSPKESKIPTGQAIFNNNNED
jgi:hypothetical protein